MAENFRYGGGFKHGQHLHFDPQTNIIDVHMSRLRNSVDKGFSKPLIHTVRGTGYVLKDE